MTESDSPRPTMPEPQAAPTPAPVAERAAGPGLLGRIGRVLLRLLVVVVLGVALGAGLFYGAIGLYRNTIEPVSNIESRFQELEDKIDLQLEHQADQARALQQRVVDLEAAGVAAGETRSEIEAQLVSLQIELERQTDELNAFGGADGELADLAETVDAVNDRVLDIETVLSTEDLPTQRILRDLQLLRAMTILTRARFSLNQVNLGLAQADMRAAREILLAVQPGGAGEPSTEAEEFPLSAALESLDSALANVLGRPAVADEELEICWRHLIEITAPLTESADSATD